MRTQASSQVLKIWRGKMHFAVATHSFEICLTRKFLDSTRFGWEEKNISGALPPHARHIYGPLRNYWDHGFASFIATTKSTVIARPFCTSNLCFSLGKTVTCSCKKHFVQSDL